MRDETYIKNSCFLNQGKRNKMNDVEKMDNGFCNQHNARCMKGVAAICIMLSHLISSPKPLTILFYGPLWVGVFFFYSGYGLYTKVNEPDYLNGFLLKKAKKIYLPFLLAESAYTLSSAAMGGSLKSERLYCAVSVLN